MVVYQIVNTVNNKKYIGSTNIKLNIRWNIHKDHAKADTNKLYKAMRKYGIDKFNMEVIDEDGDRKREEELIIQNDSINHGYNNRHAFITPEQQKMNQREISKRRYELHREEIKAINLARYYEKKEKMLQGEN